MNYRDAYPACEECPFLRTQQTERDAASADIQDSEMLIVAKQAALEHHADVAIKISTYILLQVMAAREYGMLNADVQKLLDKVDASDRDSADITMRSETQISEARSYIDTSRNYIELADIIVQKVAEDCPGFSAVRYAGQTGCKSTLIPFIDSENK
jgi:hypothetical protein